MAVKAIIKKMIVAMYMCLCFLVKSNVNILNNMGIPKKKRLCCANASFSPLVNRAICALVIPQNGQRILKSLNNGQPINKE